jgi:hypothetical protein
MSHHTLQSNNKKQEKTSIFKRKFMPFGSEIERAQEIIE